MGSVDARAESDCPPQSPEVPRQKRLDDLEDEAAGLQSLSDPDFVGFGWGMADYADLHEEP